MTAAVLTPLTSPGAASPFIPGTYLQYAWDSVSLGNALACWRRYQYSVINGWQPRGPNTAIALDFGILFHSGLEFYHKAKAAGRSHGGAVTDALQALTFEPRYANLPTETEIEELKADHDEDLDDGITLRNSKVRTRYHLFRALVWYLEHYRADPIETYITPTGKPAVEVSFRVELPIESAYISGTETPFILSGHMDRVGRHGGRLYVVDYKTTKSLSSQFFSTYALSHQISGYTFAGGVALEEPISGVVIDGIALQVGGCKFGRAESPRTPDQLKEYFEIVSEVTDRATTYALRLADDPDYLYPMNPQACYFCEFKQVCSQPPSLRKRFLAMNFKQGTPWNPLENR